MIEVGYDGCPLLPNSFLGNLEKIIMSLSPHTRVYLHTGQVKSLSEIKIGDQLMGEDSLPVTVITVRSTRRKATKVIPHRGETILCSENHPLKLKKSAWLDEESTKKLKFKRYPKLLSARVNDLSNRGIKFCRSFLLYKVAIIYQKVPVPIDPYFLGVWLGDGHAHTVGITTMDEEIKREVYQQAMIWGLKVTVAAKKENRAKTYLITRGNVCGHSREKNPFLKALRSLNLLRNKHIPPIYLQNDRDTRLKLLAGIIDTDGYLGNNYYSVTQKNKLLLEQITRLASSLGFRTVIRKITKGIKSKGFTGSYYVVSISGRIDEIPVRIHYKQATKVSTKHDRRLGGYCIKPDGYRKLIAITTEGDKAFLDEYSSVLSPDLDDVPSSSSYPNHWFRGTQERKLAEIKCFIDTHGRLPSHSVPSEKKLAHFINSERTKVREGLRTEAIHTMLVDLGVRIYPTLENFERNFGYLLEFRKNYPTRWPVYQEEFPSGNQLGAWCRTKRYAYRNGRLSKIYIEKLNEIGFPFDVQKDRYLRQLNYLAEFRSQFKRNPYQGEKYPKGNRIGDWYYRHKNKDWMVSF